MNEKNFVKEKYTKIMDIDIEELSGGSCSRPVVIWGTKIGGQICFQLLRELHIKIAAVGDNNLQMIGTDFFGICVMSLQKIKDLYPDALVVVGSILHSTTDLIIRQLRTANEGFLFCRFEQIEYLYEIKYLKRTVQDKKKLWKIINNIDCEEENGWRYRINQKVVSEYRYIVNDRNAEELKSLLLNVYGIKKLVLIIKAEKTEVAADLIAELFEDDRIGHIIVLLQNECTMYKNALECISNRVFYAICDEKADKCLLEKIGFIIDTKIISEEVFMLADSFHDCEMTEEIIVHSIFEFLGLKKEKRIIENEKNFRVHIVQLFNGLANQMLMYLFGKYLEEESDHIVIFDDTILCLDVFDEDENIKRMLKWNKSMTRKEIQNMVETSRTHDSFYHFERAEVAEVFDIPIRLLSDYFDANTWKLYLSKVKNEISDKYVQSFPLGQILLKSGIDISVVRDSILPDEFLAVKNCCCIDVYSLDRPCKKNSVTDLLLHNKKNTYYMGIWATGKEEDWLLCNRQWVKEQFKFRVSLDERNRYYADEITRSDSIMVHIRRRDFVCAGMSASVEYYKKSIRIAEAMPEYNNKKYFVFSDDLAWCQDHKEDLGIDEIESKVFYITGNTGKLSYMDMYLISLGRIGIPTPISSFSYAAMLISGTMEKYINVPRYLYDGTIEMVSLK